MVADGRAFGVSVGIYTAIAVGCLLFFGVFRKSKICKKFYAPKRYMKGKGNKPKRLPTSFWGWIAPVYSASEDEVIRVAGVDAAMYLRLLAFGCELFLGVAFWCAITVLPTNVAGGKAITNLQALNHPKPSPYTYWVSPPPPLNTASPPAPPSPDAIKAPDFYDNSIPPAPPGLTWYKYLDNVPPLPPAPSNYTWMYDSNFNIRSYSFSNLDYVTMSNVEPRSNLYWVHLITIWVVTFYTFQLLWRYSREAVQMRLRYLQTEQGAEAYSVLVQDIPGVAYGTPLHRLDTTVLAALPAAVKDPVKRTIGKVVSVGEKGVSATAGKLANTLVSNRTQGATGVQRTATGAEKFFDAPETLARLSSGSQSGNDTDGGATAPTKDVEAQATGYQPQKMVEPEIANAKPRPEQTWQSLTSTNAWGQASELLASGLTMQQMVEREFATLFSGDVESVHVVYDTAKLDKLVEEYEKLHGNLTDLLDDYTSKKRRHKKFKRKQTRVAGVKYGAWGREKYGVKPAKVDAMEWYVARLEELKRLIHEEQRAAKRATVPSAFVTFKRAPWPPLPIVTAVSTTQHSDTTAWRVSAAPHFNELLWKNLRWRAWERSVRSLVIWGAFIVLALFYLIPIGAVQALLAVDALDKNPVAHFFLHAPVLDSLITAILPSLVLRIFLALLPWLLAIMGRVQGLYSQSMLDFSVVTKYYVFQILTVFFGTLVAGSISSQIKVFIAQPGLFLTTLGTAAPLTSIFFLNYVELNALAITPIQFLNLASLVIFWVLSFFAATERAKARLWQNQFMSYGSKVPTHTITILLGMTFCCMNPLLPMMALIYFLINSLTEKYNMMYVMRARFQSGGRVWTMFFYQVIAALIIFQLSMLALLSLKQSVVPAILVIPLLPLTLLFMHFCSAIFKRPFQVLSLRAAVDLDEYRQMVGHAVHASGDQYLAPVFKFDEEEHAAVLQEAATMDRVLSGQQAVHHHEEDDDDDAASVASAAPTTPRRPVGKASGHGEP